MVWPVLETRTQPHLCEIAKPRSFEEKAQRSTEKVTEGQHKGRQLTEDMAQYRKYWKTQLMALHMDSMVKEDEKCGEKESDRH